MKTPHGCNHTHEKEPLLQQAIERLKATGQKLTRPRQSLLKAMLEMNGPFSAEDLFLKGRRSRQNPDLVTVYRSLTRFADLGIISRVDLGDNVIRYELNAHDGSHHHHVICTSCRKVEPISICGSEGTLHKQEKDLANKGYSNLTHRLEFFGLCPDCTQP